MRKHYKIYEFLKHCCSTCREHRGSKYSKTRWMVELVEMMKYWHVRKDKHQGLNLRKLPFPFLPFGFVYMGGRISIAGGREFMTDKVLYLQALINDLNIYISGALGWLIWLSMRLLISAQVMISPLMSSSPASGSVHAYGAEQAWDSLPSSFSLPLSCSCSSPPPLR